MVAITFADPEHRRVRPCSSPVRNGRGRTPALVHCHSVRTDLCDRLAACHTVRVPASSKRWTGALVSKMASDTSPERSDGIEPPQRFALGACVKCQSLRIVPVPFGAGTTDGDASPMLVIHHHIGTVSRIAKRLQAPTPPMQRNPIHYVPPTRLARGRLLKNEPRMARITRIRTKKGEGDLVHNG